MTTQRTLRRKLQKKLKHKPYRKCPKCGERMGCKLYQDEAPDTWRLFKYCGQWWDSLGEQVKPIGGCGYKEELFWSGGGTGRHIPHGQPAGERL